MWAADGASVWGEEERARRTASTLRERVMKHFGITDVFDLLAVVHEPDPAAGGKEEGEAGAGYARMVREKRLSSLAPLVFAAAFEDGDGLAVRVLEATTRLLVDQMCVLLRPEEDGDYAPGTIKASETILCFGGSLVGVDKYREMILGELERRGHKMRRWAFVDDASAVGATALALAAKH